MSVLLESIIKCVEGDLLDHPEIKQEVAKTLLALLKIRKQKNYIFISLLMVSGLEDKINFKARTEETISIHGSKIAAGIFSELTSEDVINGIKVYLEGLVSDGKNEETLEQYMSRELGVRTKGSCDPDDFQSDEEGGMIVAALAMLNSGNLEDFTLTVGTVGEMIKSDKIFDTIKRFYTEHGYVEEQGGCVSPNYGFFNYRNKKENLTISVSNFGDTIMVTVKKE